MDLDLMTDLQPPKSLFITVRCNEDYGELLTEDGKVSDRIEDDSLNLSICRTSNVAPGYHALFATLRCRVSDTTGRGEFAASLRASVTF